MMMEISDRLIALANEQVSEAQRKHYLALARQVSELEGKVEHQNKLLAVAYSRSGSTMEIREWLKGLNRAVSMNS